MHLSDTLRARAFFLASNFLIATTAWPSTIANPLLHFINFFIDTFQAILFGNRWAIRILPADIRRIAFLFFIVAIIKSSVVTGLQTVKETAVPWIVRLVLSNRILEILIANFRDFLSVYYALQNSKDNKNRLSKP